MDRNPDGSQPTKEGSGPSGLYRGGTMKVTLPDNHARLVLSLIEDQYRDWENALTVEPDNPLQDELAHMVRLNLPHFESIADEITVKMADSVPDRKVKEDYERACDDLKEILETHV